MVLNSTMVKTKPMVKPTHQRFGVRWASTMVLILSVMVPNVCPGAMIWPSRAGSREGGASAMSLRLLGRRRRRGRQLGVGVADGRQVDHARRRVQLAEQVVAQGRLVEPVDPAVPVVEVAEDDRL